MTITIPTELETAVQRKPDAQARIVRRSSCKTHSSLTRKRVPCRASMRPSIVQGHLACRDS